MKQLTGYTVLVLWFLLYPFSALAIPHKSDKDYNVDRIEISDEYFDKYVQIIKTKAEMKASKTEKKFSPSRKNWYQTVISPCPDYNADYITLIYNGYDLFQITFTGTNACHYEPQFSWKNDNQLIVDVALGRVMFLGFTFDLKKEQVTDKAQYQLFNTPVSQ